VLSLLQQSRLPRKRAVKPALVTETAPDFAHIRCPSCGWRPTALSRWSCANCARPEQFLAGCGASFNTFGTGGLCPGCQHRWRWTQCLSCQRWALHETWYVSGSNPPITRP